jgi:CBS domain-containing protein
MYDMFDRILSLRVGDVMATDPVTIDLSASMEDVSRVFAGQGLHSAPVIDEAGHCVGIITASDFVKRCHIFSAGEGQPHEVVESGEGILMEPRSYDNVSDCMTQGVQGIMPSTPLIKAARIMTQAHIHVLPVIEEHRPVGIVSNLDVVAALVNAFDEAKSNLAPPQ